jgi:uncharacterized membrane protein
MSNKKLIILIAVIAFAMGVLGGVVVYLITNSQTSVTEEAEHLTPEEKEYLESLERIDRENEAAGIKSIEVSEEELYKANTQRFYDALQKVIDKSKEW